MAFRKIPDEEYQEAIDALTEHGSQAEAARVLKKTRQTFQHVLDEAKKKGFVPSEDAIERSNANQSELREQIKVLSGQLKQKHEDELSRAMIRKRILKLAEQTPEPPKWLTRKHKKGTIGVPTLFCSDWHWDEVVNPDEIGGVNKFNREIAHKRVRKLLDTAEHLLLDCLSDAKYPGIVLALGGDLLSGTIHEELTMTNEAPVLDTVLDIQGVLITVIERLAEKFGNVFVVSVCGNHGRTTRKPPSKQRAKTNFDWFISCQLERHFKGWKNVSFYIPEGSDALYRIYNHTYLLTHGDQFRGGDGITGALMPIMRGRHKKSTRDVSIDQPWDTIIMGHWHTLWQSPNLIVNGSLKGYDEYAYTSNFTWERAAQALWITHPDHGITFQMPVYVDEPRAENEAPWVSVFEAAA